MKETRKETNLKIEYTGCRIEKVLEGITTRIRFWRGKHVNFVCEGETSDVKNIALTLLF